MAHIFSEFTMPPLEYAAYKSRADVTGDKVIGKESGAGMAVWVRDAGEKGGSASVCVCTDVTSLQIDRLSLILNEKG